MLKSVRCLSFCAIRVLSTLAVATPLWFASHSVAATFTANWIGTNGQWTDAANWSTADYPHNNGGTTYDVNSGSVARSVDLNGDAAPSTIVENLTLGGAIDNAATFFTINGTGAVAPSLTVNGTFNWNQASFTGSGTLSALQGIKFNPAGRYWLTNSNSWNIDMYGASTYAFYPSTTVSDNRSFTNTGTLTVKSGGTLDIVSRRLIAGAGTMAVESGATLTYASPFASPNTFSIANTLNNSGTVKVLNNGNGAALTFSNGGTHAGGSFEVAAGTSLVLNGTHTITSPSAHNAITGAGNVTLQNVSLDANSNYNVTGNTLITGNSSFSGATTFNNLTIQNTSTTNDLSGTADILVNGNLNLGGTGRGGRLLGSGKITILGDLNFSSAPYTNFAVGAGRTLEIHGNTTYQVYPVQGAGHLVTDNGYQMDVSGHIINKAGAVWTMLDTTRPMRGTGTFLNEAGATFQRTAGTDVVNRIPTIAPAFTNQGTVTSTSGTLRFLSTNAAFKQTAGQIVLQNAPIILDGTASLIGGEVKGNGTLTATIDAVTGGGTGLTLSPGMSVGTLNIAGSATLNANDKIAIELASPASFDVLNVSGVLNLGSCELDLEMLSGFSASELDSMVIIKAGTLLGTFANAPAGMMSMGDYLFQISYAGNQITLSNFTQVPEPTSLLLLACGLLTLRGRRRNRLV